MRHQVPNDNNLNDLEEKISYIKWSEKHKRAKSFFKALKNKGYSAYEWFKSLPYKTRRNILIIAIASLPTGAAIKYVSDKIDEIKAKQELLAKRNSMLGDLEKKYKITDRSSFTKLYEDALPLIQVSMFPTECLVLTPYSDNKSGKKNTIGLGSYYYPINGDPKSTNWEKASRHFQNHKKLSISGDKALELADGWYRTREHGRMFRSLYTRLLGAELNIHEFAAIATLAYNNEKNGKDLCNFVRDNYQNPMKCAQQIVSYSASKGNDGIGDRHLHEAYMYLNYDNYVQKIYDFKVYKGKSGWATSVTHLSSSQIKPGIKAVNSGNKDRILKEQNRMVNYNEPGSKKVKDIIRDNISNKETYYKLMSFYDAYGEISFKEAEKQKNQQEKAEEKEEKANNQQNENPITYDLALKTYAKAVTFKKKGKTVKANATFKIALSQFNKAIENGYDKADIHNDIAVTYYHLGEYQNCIYECRKVLAMNDPSAYPAANYNAAMAYEKKGEINKAVQNYQAGIKNGGDVKKFRAKINKLNNKSLYRNKRSNLQRRG